MTAQDIDAMTPEQLRVSVAESQGIKITGEQHRVPFGWKDGDIVMCPDFPGSRDALAPGAGEADG